MKLIRSLFAFLVFLSVIMFPVLVSAQTAEIPFHFERYELSSGIYNGQSGIEAEIYLAFSETIKSNGVPWLRLAFSEANLGENSFMKITSLADKAFQILDASTLSQWQNTSAYFNGESVKLELYVAPGDKNININIGEIMAGDWVNDVESQCGPTDDRVSSNDPKVGRLLNIGCTAWIIPNGKLVSAGHCLASSGFVNTLEFNVPPSLPGGTIQHPGPEDQYVPDVSTIVFTNGGIGNDWGVFEVFPNTVTGMMPIDAQGDFFVLAQDLGPSTIRITGYGVDSGMDNQTQQTHAGPNAGSSGTTMRYQTDTEGGNSGSPVIDDATGNAVGVHTHGGCTTSGTGNNSGTSFFNTAFWNAVDMGAGGGGNPNISVSLNITPSSGNGIFDLNFIITNNEAVSHNFDVWIEVMLPNGNTRTLFNRNLTLNGGQSINRTRNLDFSSKPLGTYTFTIYAGVNPTEIWSSDIKTYDKTSIELSKNPAEVNEPSITPEETTLAGNYPNPFNPSTTIRYGLNSDQWVTIKIYNSLGQELTTLVNQPEDSGFHDVVWNGTDSYGRSVASGIYIYRLTAVDEGGTAFSEAKQMILLK